MKRKIWCARCGSPHLLESGHINRARCLGLRVYCSKKCSDMFRAVALLSKDEIRERKRVYDIAYRRKNAALIKSKKREYNKRTYDAGKAAIERKKNMARHVEYCRRPEYRKYKQAHDRKRRETDDRYRYKLPPDAPDDLVKSIRLFQQLQKEMKREHKRA